MGSVGVGPFSIHYPGVRMSAAKENRTSAVLLNLMIMMLAIMAALIAYRYVPDYLVVLVKNENDDVVGFIILLIVLSFSRSMPLPTSRKDEEFNIAPIIIYTALIYKGIGATVLLMIISSFFTFVRHEDGRIHHAFNTPLSKTVFNCASVIVPLYFGWLCYASAYHDFRTVLPPNVVLQLPDILLPSVVYLLVFLLINSLCMAALFRLLHHAPFFHNLRYGFFSMLPTMMMLAPLGFLLAYFFVVSAYIALLFFIPLLFARFAFKLYLDSREQYMKTISTLTTAIEAKDEYTEGHSRRVGEYAVEIATFMGIKGPRIENIKVAAVLHDIGKIGIEDKILRKPGKLTPEEWDRIRQHPSIGVHILAEVEMPQTVRDMIEYHHLHYDNSGYPPKRGDREIPMEVHIITLADAYDAMTSDRPYRRALPEEVALQNIMEGKGTQFHPDVVDAFLRMKATAVKH